MPFSKKSVPCLFVLMLWSHACDENSSENRDARAGDAAISDVPIGFDSAPRDTGAADTTYADTSNQDARLGHDAHANDGGRDAVVNPPDATLPGPFSLAQTIAGPSEPRSFGARIALSADGNTLVVGAFNAATVYERIGNQWNSGTPLAALSGAREHGFALAISRDGSTIAVGDFANNDGTVLVYTRTGDTWNAGVQIERPEGARLFGVSVALSGAGGDLAVGDYRTYGAVTLYRRSNGSWSNSRTIVPLSQGRSFGGAIALSSDGNTVIIGDQDGGGDERGSATVYRRTANDWSIEGNLFRPLFAGDFGEYIALSDNGSVAVVGDQNGGNEDNVDETNDGYGSATVYVHNGTSWNLGFRLARSMQPFDYGGAVSISGNGEVVVVGDSNSDEGAAGRVTLYTRIGDRWSDGELFALPNENTSRFGFSLALSADARFLAIGDVGHSGAGNAAIYMYAR